MLQELLNALKEALENDDKKEASRIEKQLNKVGMDSYTIRVLLKEGI